MARKAGPAAAPSRRRAETKPKGPPFLAVCGHANLDVVLQVQELPPPGGSVPILERRTLWGGTAANIARHAAGLGVPTRLWSRVGMDFPPDWTAALTDDGVDLAFLDRVPKALTPTCYVLTDPLDRQSYCIDQGPMATMAENPPPPELLDGMEPGSWLHLSTGDPLAYAHVATEARGRGIFVALDPGQEMRFLYDAESLGGLLGLCDLLFLNEFEAGVACDLMGLSSADELLQFVETIVLTRAAKGASLLRLGKPTLQEPAVPVPRVVDPTGAGDALRSGWYAALHQGRTVEQALRWGQAAAAVKVQHPGGQERVIRPRDIEAVLKGA